MAQSIPFENPDSSPPGARFAITLQLENPEILNKLAQMGDEIISRSEKVFNNFIFETHKYLIRITPIDTGELRGGWTAFLDRYGIDYSRQIFDTSIAIKAPGREYHIDPTGIEKGKTFSQSDAAAFDNTITNNVPYGIFLDQGTSRIPAQNFVESAKYKAEFLFEKTYTDWFKKLEEQDDAEVVDPDPPEELIS